VGYPRFTRNRRRRKRIAGNDLPIANPFGEIQQGE
jgi:hypothetical protein